MARYWFKPRRSGYVATPVNWDGWALTVAVAAIVAISVAAMNLLADRANFAVWIAWAAIIAAVVVSFVRINRSKNRWRAALALECPTAGRPNSLSS
jgi:hypothetical protein